MTEKPKDKDASNSKTVSTNRKASFEYKIGDTLEAGIVLAGTEVKSLRLGKVNLGGCYADVAGDSEIFLYGLHIPEYQQAGRHLQHDPFRPKKLLLKRREINKFIGAIQKKGITLVPLTIYFNAKGRVKLKLGIAEGKKKYEKRETMKERDWNRDKARIMKGER